MKSNFLSSFSILLITAFPVNAYETAIHRPMTEAALLRSTLSDPYTLRRLGLYSYVDGNRFFVPDNGVYEKYKMPTIPFHATGIVRLGATIEDSGERSLQHFFDPQNDRGLTFTWLFTDSPVVVGLRSHQWVLSRPPFWTDEPATAGLTVTEQYFGVENAKDYLELAVMNGVPLERHQRFGQFFAALGHVIHHVQDMAQPDHVRNDSHCNLEQCWWAGLSINEDAYDPSEYETYVANVGYQVFNQEDYPVVALNSYLEFWTNANSSGMADFTNRFAVSKDTNFRGDPQNMENHPEFPYPDGAAAVTSESVISKTLEDGTQVTVTTVDLRAPYVDHYMDGQPATDHITAAHSLYFHDLTTAEFAGTNTNTVSFARFTIGPDTFHSAASRLLPRAEAYSAGLINYLLRGRLGVKLPWKGYYALSDHTPDGSFSTLAFDIRNETPDVEPNGQSAIPQDIGFGDIVAVVSYRPNPCYEDDLSGELHADEPDMIPSDCTVSQWMDTSETRVVSAPVSVGAIPRDWTEFAFDFSANPIPFSARDVEVYFVFRGQLGSEENAIVIERHNVSEPTYYSTINSTDRYWTSSGWADSADIPSNQDISDDLIAAQYRDLFYGFNGLPGSTGPDRLDAAHFQRVVGLFDPAQFSITVHDEPEIYWPSESTYSLTSLRNETREVVDEINFTFGNDISSIKIYRNAWCDENGCTTSGLMRRRGVSQWATLWQYYRESPGYPGPSPDDYKQLPLIEESAKQPVTVNE